MQLTSKQKQVLDHLKDFVGRHGYAPTLEQIGKRCRIQSLATVHAHMARLEEHGWITREKKRRGFALTDKALGIRSRLVPVTGAVMPDGTLGEIADGPTILDVPSGLGGDERAFALRIHGTPVPGSGLQDDDYIIARETDDETGRELVIADIDGRIRLAKHGADTGSNGLRNDAANDRMAIRAVITGMLRAYDRRA